jgi:hypothetical protein
LDEEKSKHAGLAQENGFGSTYLHSLQSLIKGTATVCTCRKECNKFDLTYNECFSLLLVVPNLFAVPVSVFWVGLQKSK